MNKKTKYAINTVAKMVLASSLVLLFQGQTLAGAIAFALSLLAMLSTLLIEDGATMTADVIKYLAVFFNDLYLSFWAAALVELTLGKYVTSGIIAFMVLTIYLVKKFFPRKEDYNV